MTRVLSELWQHGASYLVAMAVIWTAMFTTHVGPFAETETTLTATVVETGPIADLPREIPEGLVRLPVPSNLVPFEMVEIGEAIVLECPFESGCAEAPDEMAPTLDMDDLDEWTNYSDGPGGALSTTSAPEETFILATVDEPELDISGGLVALLASALAIGAAAFWNRRRGRRTA